MTTTEPRRNLPAVITLLFVAPLVAEYLLGDLPLKLLPALIFLSPAYGGAAILIRETARRTGRGWPTMLLLGAAYTLIAEGLTTQSLFNPNYLKMNMHLLNHAYIPAWGIGAWWTVCMFNLHTFWSMGASIVLVEGLFPAEAESPWLGPIGDSVVAVVFVLGTAANVAIGFKQNQFLASHAQLLSAAALSLLLIVSAFFLPPSKPRITVGTVPSTVPSTWITGAVAFVLGMSVLSVPPAWGWGAMFALVALDALFLVLIALFSSQAGWSSLHIFSLAAAGALDYGIHAFNQKPLLGSLLGMRISNTVFLVAAVGVIWLGSKRILRSRA